MTDKPAIAALLAAGRMDFETPDGGWRAADGGLREEVITAVMKIEYSRRLYTALRKGEPVVLRDDALDLTVRWSPK